MNNIFRKYDIRAMADEELPNEVIWKIGKALGTYLVRHQKHNIVFGKDNRISSKRISEVLINSLLSTGCNIINLGDITTPILNFSISLFQANTSVMVTGSHNPPKYNGIKIQIDKTPLHGKELYSLINIINSGRFNNGYGSMIFKDIIPYYFSCIIKEIEIDQPVKVVVDCGNGNTSNIAPLIFEELGCDVFRLYCKSDGSFPHHHPDPAVKKNLFDLCAKVKETCSDIGIAFDGDGNRLGVVNELGQVISPDHILAIFARNFIRKNGGVKVICDVKASQALIEDVENNGGKIIMCKSGYPFLLETLFKEDATIGGELAGHICINQGNFVYGDAIYVACSLLQILSNEANSLSHLFNNYPKYISSSEFRIPCPDDKKFRICDQIKDEFKKIYANIDIDGIRIKFSNSCWALIRASNTEPVLSIRYEAKNETEFEETKEVISKKLREFGLTLKEE